MSRRQRNLEERRRAGRTGRGRPRTFYRIVTTNPPTADDFRSHQELGRPLLDPRRSNEWSGLSAFGTLRQARKKALQYPSKGRFIAELRVPDSSPIRFARTGRAHSHYTLYGEKADLVRCVVAVHWAEDRADVGRL